MTVAPSRERSREGGGSKVWASAPGGRIKTTLISFPTTFCTRSFRGKMVVATVGFPESVFRGFFQKTNIPTRSKTGTRRNNPMRRREEHRSGVGLGWDIKG